MGLIGSAVQAVGGLASNIVGGLFNANQAKKDRAFQERMYNKQYQDSIDFWNMQNQFNLPSAALQRLKDANLNPLLYYGSAGAAQNVANQQAQLPSAPSGAKASASFSNPFEGFALMSENKELLKAQADKERSDSILKQQQALESAAKTIGERIKADKEGLEYKYQYDTYYQRMDQLQAEIEERRSIASLNASLEMTEESKRNEIQSNIDYIEKQGQYIDAKIQNENRMTDAQIKEIDQNITNSIKTTVAMCKQLNASALEAVAKAGYARAQQALIDNPEYRKYFNWEALGKAYEALQEGKFSEYENILMEEKARLVPKAGDGSFLNKANKFWRGFWQIAIGVPAEELGKALGGSVTVSKKVK